MLLLRSNKLQVPVRLGNRFCLSWNNGDMFDWSVFSIFQLNRFRFRSLENRGDRGTGSGCGDVLESGKSTHDNDMASFFKKSDIHGCIKSASRRMTASVLLLHRRLPQQNTFKRSYINFNDFVRECAQMKHTQMP